MDNIEIDGNFLEVLQNNTEPLMIDGRTYTKENNKWLSEGGYSIEYDKYYFCFFKDGKEHREDDKPALIETDGTKEWYKNGEWHREDDKPAVILGDGSMFWYKDGKNHREGDEPAVIWGNGTKMWYKNGKLHREGDKPALILEDGAMEWYKYGVKIERA